MKSKIYLLSSIAAYIKNIFNVIKHDKVTVYAAQASFFVITSSVPFISLLIALTGLLLPDNINLSAISLPFISSAEQTGLSEIFKDILNDLKTAPSVSLLSFSAFTTLWTASRGISAIRSGIETVYGSEKGLGYVKYRMTSVLTTLLFIVFLTVLTALLLFGDFLTSLLNGRFSYIIELMRIPLLALLMAVMFTAFYTVISSRSTIVSHKAVFHIPGALFSSVGWLVFSYLYTIYINHFPGASKVYGGLAAICLIMLWLYFCMMILLLGAEINKIYFAGKKTAK